MNSSQAYKTLQLQRDASFDQVKDAYRKLALQHHPDKNKNEESERRFKVITEAYHFLKNQNKHTLLQEPEKTQEKSDFTQRSKTFYKRTKWGKDGQNETPEANWGKYTKDFEANEEWWKRYESEFWDKYEKTVNEQTDKQPEDRGFPKKRKEFELKVDEGAEVAFYPLVPVKVEAIGLEWPLQDVEMEPGGLISTSNKIRGSELKLKVNRHGLLAILPMRYVGAVLQELRMRCLTN